MNFTQTNFEGLYLIEYNKFTDNRGEFIKIFNDEIFIQNGINFNIKESYYSSSKKSVIRGMHFQRPPFDHDKLVYVSKGKILDVVLDLRENSKTYGKTFNIELSEYNNKALFIPKGFAHGFYTIEDNSIVVYSQSIGYNKECDNGIKYDSFNFTWPTDNYIISDRDRGFISFSDFITPFN